MKAHYERAKALGNQKDERYFIRICAHFRKEWYEIGIVNEPHNFINVPNKGKEYGWKITLIVDTILSHFERKQLDENGLLPCPHCGGGGDIRKHENGRFYLVCKTKGTGICLNPSFDIFSTPSMTLYFNKDQARSDWNTRNGVQL